MVAVSNGVNMHMLIINIHSVFFEPHFISVCLKFPCLKILDLLWPLLPLATTCGGGGAVMGECLPSPKERFIQSLVCFSQYFHCGPIPRLPGNGTGLVTLCMQPLCVC